MKPDLASLYLHLKKELEELIQSKLQNPKLDLQIGEELLSAIRLLVTEDPCTGRFVYGRQEKPKLSPKPAPTPAMKRPNSKNPLPTSLGGGGDNANSQLQVLVVRAGHNNPLYTTKQLSSGLFRSTVEFTAMQFVGEPCGSKKQAEKDVASEALNWLLGGWPGSGNGAQGADIDHISMMLKSRKPSKQHRRH